MIRSVFASLLVLFLLPAALAVAAPEEDGAEPSPTKDEQAVAYIAKVKKELSKQGEGTARATAAKLAEMWADKELADASKKDIPGLLAKYSGNKNETIAVAGVQALQTLGADYASKPLIKVIGKVLKAKEPSVQVYSACLKAFGAMADTNAKTMKELTKLLKYKMHDVVGKTAKALAGYKGAPGKIRKELLEEVIKQSEGTYSAANNNDTNQKRKWNIIQSGVMAALNGLSGRKFKNPAEARSWFNDNKKNKVLWR